MSEEESKQLDVEYIVELATAAATTAAASKVKSDVITEVKEMSFTFCFPLFFRIRETNSITLFEKFS